MVGSQTTLSALTLFAFVACGGATAVVPDEGSGGTGGATSSGGLTGVGAKSVGGIAAAGGKSTGGVTGAGGKTTGGVTGAGGKTTGGVTGAGGKSTGGSTGTRWANEYDQSCVYDDNCVAVTEGPVCSCNSCVNASISRKEIERWEGNVVPCARLPCDPIGCVEMAAACIGGRCEIRTIDYILPGQFDRTCSAQSDCYLVPVGDLCSGCNCEFDAVSLKGLEAYRIRVANLSCGSPGTGCDCATPRTVCQTQCAAVF